jgi:hypothetical protein
MMLDGITTTTSPCPPGLTWCDLPLEPLTLPATGQALLLLAILAAALITVGVLTIWRVSR